MRKPLGSEYSFGCGGPLARTGVATGIGVPVAAGVELAPEGATKEEPAGDEVVEPEGGTVDLDEVPDDPAELPEVPAEGPDAGAGEELPEGVVVESGNLPSVGTLPSVGNLPLSGPCAKAA